MARLPWAGTLIAIGYTLLRWTLAMGVWALGLPGMGVPPLVLIGALVLDLTLGRKGPGAAGIAFALAFTLSDYPLTSLLSGRPWGPLEWAGTLAAASATAWASARLGHLLATVGWRSRYGTGIKG